MVSSGPSGKIRNPVDRNEQPVRSSWGRFKIDCTRRERQSSQPKNHALTKH